MTETSACFVVMPFGIKPFPDGSGRTYDFDKVFRVLIQRAVREAGMMPIRADEGVSSALIHTDMFRDLRDRAVVVADLSLDNPNVFYELGMRHVMSANGTVLMCRKGALLPFDVKLSRVIFYEYDGKSFDWEEVENVVKHLQLALQEARKGRPDSPVHALLASVLRVDPNHKSGSSRTAPEKEPDAEPLANYQKMLADSWQGQGESAENLLASQRGSVFGARALGYFCLNTDPLSETARRVANHLNDGQQHRLANELYSRLHQAGKLQKTSLLAYSSSYSEVNQTLEGADYAISLVDGVLSRFAQQANQGQLTPDDIGIYAECNRRLSGLRQWRWYLTKDAEDLERAIEAFSDTIKYNDQARARGAVKHPGYVAQARLKQLVLLRIRDADIDRPDSECHRDAVLALRPLPDDDVKGVSYLGWYQAIALADMGAAEESNRKALATFAEDNKLKDDPRYWEIGRRQYALLRRFLEQYSRQLRNPSLTGQISQALQVSQVGRL